MTWACFLEPLCFFSCFHFCITTKWRPYLSERIFKLLLIRLLILEEYPWLIAVTFHWSLLFGAFQARGLKKHLKRLNAPKHWMLDKLGGAFVCCVNLVSIFFGIYIIIVYTLLFIEYTLFYDLLCRPPNHHLDLTSQGNACLWSLFCVTGWNMLSHIVKLLLFWCRDMFLLMGRLGQIRLTLRVSWVCHFTLITIARLFFYLFI